MEPRKHTLKPEEITEPLRAILDECKAAGQPVYIASEEHGEYVVVPREEYSSQLDAMDYADAVREIEAGIRDAREGRVISAEMALRELRKKYDL